MLYVQDTAKSATKEPEKSQGNTIVEGECSETASTIKKIRRDEKEWVTSHRYARSAMCAWYYFGVDVLFSL